MKNPIKIWSDIYKLPLEDEYIDDDFRSKRIYDSDGNFVFQFLKVGYETQINILHLINGNLDKHPVKVHFKHDDGYILANGAKLMLIRGWGNLTGTGGHNLNEKEAANVQDTFIEYVLAKLNNLQ